MTTHSVLFRHASRALHTIRAGATLTPAELEHLLEDVVDALAGKPFDWEEERPAVGVEPPRWRAQLLNEAGLVTLTGTRAAVDRCVELGRFVRPLPGGGPNGEVR